MNTLTKVGSLAVDPSDTIAFDYNFAQPATPIVELYSGGYPAFGVGSPPPPTGALTIDLWLFPDSARRTMQAVRDAWNALSRAGLLTIQADFNGQARECRGFVAVSMPQSASDLPHLRQRARLDITVPVAEWRSITDAEDSQSIAATDTTFDLTVDGSLPALPVFTITTSASQSLSALTIQRLVSSAVVDEIAYGAVPSSSELIIDCGKSSVTRNGGDAYADFSAGARWFQLPPGTASIKVSRGASDDDFTFKTAWRSRWL